MDFKFTYTGLWHNLKFNSLRSISGANGKQNWRFKDGNTQIEYKNRRYKSVAVFAAKRLVISELEGELNSMLPKFRKNFEKQLRDVVLEQQKNNQEVLISNQESQSESWGVVNIAGGLKIIAKDATGAKVSEALMLYYDDEETHTIEIDGFTKTTKTVCHIDLSPQVSANSSKNIVMTQVQGRDYTRKELVSGGDLQFSINGSIVSNERGVYPTEAVKKFIKVMEYNGILKVKFMMFEPFNVTQVIVKDYSLGQQTYKNIQPYSFSCVAVEADEDIQLQKDTISTINKELSLSPMDQWYSFILSNKLASMAASMSTEAITSTVNSAATSGAALGLDELTQNI